MRILVCAKQVPDTNEVKIDPKTGTMIREGVPSIWNPDDANALEVALVFKDENLEPKHWHNYGTTEFRNTGVSWCHAFGRIGGASAPIVAGIIIGIGQGYAVSFMFYVIPAVIGLLAAVFLVKTETKGKSLDELAEIS